MRGRLLVFVVFGFLYIISVLTEYISLQPGFVHVKFNVNLSHRRNDSQPSLTSPMHIKHTTTHNSIHPDTHTTHKHNHAPVGLLTFLGSNNKSGKRLVMTDGVSNRVPLDAVGATRCQTH